jgi:hypothetical protein
MRRHAGFAFPQSWIKKWPRSQEANREAKGVDLREGSKKLENTSDTTSLRWLLRYRVLQEKGTWELVNLISRPRVGTLCKSTEERSDAMLRTRPWLACPRDGLHPHILCLTAPGKKKPHDQEANREATGYFFLGRF